jgi:hypothetical protein
VIWCEDRSEIAYYDQSPGSGDVTEKAHFDAGDLVQFEFCRQLGTRLEVFNLSAAGPVCHDMPPAVPGRRGARSASGEAAPVIDLRTRHRVTPTRVTSDLSRRG